MKSEYGIYIIHVFGDGDYAVLDFDNEFNEFEAISEYKTGNPKCNKDDRDFEFEIEEIEVESEKEEDKIIDVIFKFQQRYIDYDQGKNKNFYLVTEQEWKSWEKENLDKKRRKIDNDGDIEEYNDDN